MRTLHLATPICDAGIITTYIRIKNLCYSFYKRGYLLEESSSSYWLSRHSAFAVLSLSLSLSLSASRDIGICFKTRVIKIVLNVYFLFHVSTKHVVGGEA